METITIDTQLCIEPRYLTSQIRKHIYNKLKTQLVDKCTQEYGYITDVDENITILSNKIATSGCNVLANVRCTITRLKPRVGDEFNGIVCMIYGENGNGIFVEIQNKMKVLVPFEQMAGYKYNKSKQIFQNDRGDKIGEKSEVVIVIQKIQYKSNNFNCIGRLKTV